MNSDTTASDNMVTMRDPGDLAAAVKKGRGGPDTWNPPFCGDLDMVIKRDGSWFYLGSPIGRQALVSLFASVLRLEDGKYYLVTPVEKIGITVEDAPFTAIDVQRQGEDLVFTTNVGDQVTAGPDHAIRVAFDAAGEPSPYIHIRRGLEALITRSMYYHLVSWATETALGDNRYAFMINSGGQSFSLGEFDGETG